jgi:hypothetical protein
MGLRRLRLLWLRLRWRLLRSEQAALDEQRAVCEQHGVLLVPAPADAMCGFATSTAGKLPMNGLRHPPENGTCGWYLWFGEDFSQEAGFFDARCVRHIEDEYPLCTKYLGLPPGYRFLIADGYVDTWFDDKLLEI